MMSREHDCTAGARQKRDGCLSCPDLNTTPNGSEELPARDVVFAADTRFLPHLCVAILSLLKTHRDLRLHVIHAELSDSDLLILKRLAEAHGCSLSHHKVVEQLFCDLPLTLHLTKATYLRLAIPSLISAEKVLYLDSDLIVLHPLDELLAAPLGTSPLMAVRDIDGEASHDLPMRPNVRYFNAGVMLMNLAAWRLRGLSEQIIAFAKANPQRLKFADQCAINAVIVGDWLEAGPEFNFMRQYWATGIRPRIIHFTGGTKPWHIRYKGPGRTEYWNLRRQTPYWRLLSEDAHLVTYMKHYVASPLKAKLKSLLTKSLR